MERCDVEIVWARGKETPEKFGVWNSSRLFDKGQGFTGLDQCRAEDTNSQDIQNL